MADDYPTKEKARNGEMDYDMAYIIPCVFIIQLDLLLYYCWLHLWYYGLYYHYNIYYESFPLIFNTPLIGPTYLVSSPKPELTWECAKS